MIIETLRGCSYVLTCTTACTVYAVLPSGGRALVAEADKAGQFAFVAPTHSVEVSDDHALVTKVFKGAVLGLSARNGVEGHVADTTVHVTAAERARWMATPMVDASGNMALTGDVTTMGSLTAEASITIPGTISASTLVGKLIGTVATLRELGFGRVPGGGPDYYFSCGNNGLALMQAPVGAQGAQMVWQSVGGGMTFHSGVTMSGTCNVAGKISGDGGMDLTGRFFHNGAAYIEWRNTPSDEDCISVNTDAGGVWLRIRRRGFYMASDPEPDDVLNVAEMDARYVRLRTDLTAAQYAALEVKDARSLYVTSDTGRVFLGAASLN